MQRFDYTCLDRNVAWTTQKAYRGQILGYLQWLNRNRARLANLPSERKCELYLLKRVVHDRVGSVARKQAFFALLFLYQRVLKLDIGEIRKLRPQPEHKHLPVLLDHTQVLSVLQAVEDSPSAPYRLIACLLYGCGLRLSEALKLRVKDVSISENRLVLRDTKSRCDRNIKLPESLQIPMQRQLERVHLLWEQDCERRLPVSLPGLDGLRKSHRANPHNKAWWYVFPQPTPCPNPQALPEDRHRLYRHHLHESGVQRAVRNAAMKSGVEGVLTPHALRHAFASHLDARGEQVTTIQQLLGHKNIETTMIYVHRQQTSVPSPLDDAVAHAQLLTSTIRPALALPFATA